MALTAEAPVVQTSSTITTRAPSCRTLDAARRSVFFLGLADQKTVHNGAPGWESARQRWQ